MVSSSMVDRCMSNACLAVHLVDAGIEMRYHASYLDECVKKEKKEEKKGVIRVRCSRGSVGCVLRGCVC